MLDLKQTMLKVVLKMVLKLNTHKKEKSIEEFAIVAAAFPEAEQVTAESGPELGSGFSLQHLVLKVRVEFWGSKGVWRYRGRD